jgi:holo-ACP synthase / triphosphoribosyl-dephospho-CoA synthase
LTALQDILSAREERGLLRQKANGQGKAAISLNLNIPGTPKTNLCYARFFELCKDQLKNWLLANRVFIDQEKEVILHHAAGDFYIVPLKYAGIQIRQLKQITEQFELNHPLGRFIDVDVAGENGMLFSSGKEKLCFFCHDYPAIDCIRSHRHLQASLRDFQQAKIRAYLAEERLGRLSQKISSMAVRAILYELSLTPKPGLVDPSGNGVHTDMDFRTFIDSTAVISSFFAELFRKGFGSSAGDLKDALPVIRNIGLSMEKEMFSQTRGINTQKGIIFLMGISLFSVGYVLKAHDTFNPDLFVATVKTICANLLETEFVHRQDKLTHGELCFEKYHTGGIRYEAENGFPTIFLHAFPMLEKENNTGTGALIKTLLTVMAVLNDTNIIYRSDMQRLLELQGLCKKVLEDFSMEAYAGVTNFCMQHKISPGGSADLLSMTIFIFLLKNEL